MKLVKIVSMGLLFSCSAFLQAQTTIYDANRLMGSDLNGTARFVGMGGAMGALGGDITTMGTNPAGIGIYRSNDVMLSFGFDNTGMKANDVAHDKFHGSFDNVGFVFATKIGNHTPLRFANFGFNYRKMKSFSRSMLLGGVFNTSQTVQMANMLNFNFDGQFDPILEKALKSDDAFVNPELPWLGIMAYNAYLVNPNYKQKPSQSPSAPAGNTGGVNGQPLPEGEELFEGYTPYWMQGDKVQQQYSSKESGGIHAFDLNGALNFHDRFYLGATLGLYCVDYDRSSVYNEDFTDAKGNGQGGYTLGNEFGVNGSGVDFKLGFILRPFEMSSFRIGAAVHTPTYFSLTERNRAYLDFDVVHNDEIKKGVSKPYDAAGRDTEGEYDYRLITPWKFNVNMGYTVGSFAAFGVEYEYSDRSAGRLKDPDGYEMGQTADIEAMMKAVHTFRVGGEFKLMPEMSLRLGYNYISSPMKSDAFKYLAPNSMRTDTEFANPGETQNYAFGLGYRGKSFYMDMAYLLNTYKETFYAFDCVDLPGTEVTHTNHKVMLTLGMRF